MPTYQYACTACGHRFETVQSFSDAALTDCPECAGRLRKVFSAVGVVFKGSGFYRTDSRAAANGAKGKSDGEVAAKGTDKSGEKSGGEKSSADKGADKTKAEKSSTSARQSSSSGSQSSSSGSSGSGTSAKAGSSAA